MVCPVSTPESQLDRLSDASCSRYKHDNFINKLQSSNLFNLRYNNKDIIKMYIVIIIINANHHDNEKGLAQSLI